VKRTNKVLLITGTHTTPAIELINQLKNDAKTNWEIHYIGRKYNSSDSKYPSIESKLLPQLGINFHPISCGKLDRRWLPNTLKGIPQTLKAFIKSSKLISKINPDIVVSFGGYVSVPVVIAASLKKIPSITHEQTLTNSLSTRINSLFVTKIALSFNNQNQIESLPKNKSHVTGNLLRSQIFRVDSPKFSKIKTKKPIIYITAGNQGSHSINEVVRKLIPQLNDFLVIHQTGSRDYKKSLKLTHQYENYLVYDYIGLADIGWILNKADIIISRSGANTSQEIVALKKKSILIPLPFSQQDEQLKNALWASANLPQITSIIKQDDLEPKLLLNEIDKLSQKTSPKKDKIKHEKHPIIDLIYSLT
jgi:UDP-N-acetylglucosamine--N-acetylmuramyl-(pentapeptide) pyrophosphoryl-undecaprenol N-acetylglucosamine transferase